jgi:hypothetical protein
MLQRSNSDVKSGAFTSSVWMKNEKFVTYEYTSAPTPTSFFRASTPHILSIICVELDSGTHMRCIWFLSGNRV